MCCLYIAVLEGGCGMIMRWQTYYQVRIRMITIFIAVYKLSNEGKNMFSVIQYKILILLSVLFMWLPASAWAQTSVGCDDTYVTLAANDLIVDVRPTGADDTDNIQCALEHATDVGVPIVRLKAGDFFISNIMIENFKGTLQGVTRASTTLTILDTSIDCEAMVIDGMIPAAIKFIRGEPRLRYMRIEVGTACMLPIAELPLYAVVHFTGRNTNDASCGNDVIFGAVDRVDFVGPGRDEFALFMTVIVAAEGEFLGGCKDTLLGTFKLNQSSISDANIGLYTAMRSGAQVDISFTDFNQLGFSVAIANSNQSTTITSNVFATDGASLRTGSSTGIYLGLTNSFAPTTTRLVVNNNTFTFSGAPSDVLDVIKVAEFRNSTETQAVSLAVTNNVFNIYGNNIIGVLGVDIDNAAVSANTFNGFGWTGITVNSYLRDVSGWVITANNGFGSYTADSADISIASPQVSQTIIGPGQGASIIDAGNGTVILPGSSGIDGSVNTVSSSSSVTGAGLDQLKFKRRELRREGVTPFFSVIKWN